jgi:hypothetical protein
VLRCLAPRASGVVGILLPIIACPALPLVSDEQCGMERLDAALARSPRTVTHVRSFARFEEDTGKVVRSTRVRYTKGKEPAPIKYPKYTRPIVS